MSKEEIVYVVIECLNCQTLNNSLNEFCISCGVLLISEKQICSKCKNPIKIDDEICNECENSIATKEPDNDNIKDFYKEEKERFIEIIYNKKSRDHIKDKYGEKGFDIFTDFIDWKFLNLFEIVEEELKYLPTAKYILAEDASEILLTKYNLEKEYTFQEKVKRIFENLNMKTKTGNLLQHFPEVGISFSIVAEIYKKYFNFENKMFEKDEKEELTRSLLRTLVNFYSTILRNPNVKDEENIIERKLILLSTILFDITFCIDLGDSLSDSEYYECENIINERLMRSALLYDFFKKKKKQEDEIIKNRNICREIINDLGIALYLQWRTRSKKIGLIFELYVKKIFEFAEEGIDLPYFKILEEFISDLYYMYEGVGPFPWGESSEAVPYLIKTIDILNGLEEKEEERRERIGAYIRAYEFYRNNREYVVIDMMKDEKIIQIMLEFFEKYYEIDSKIDKGEGIRKEIGELVSYIRDEKEEERVWQYMKTRIKE